jgi:type II secretion system protein H
MNDPRRAIVKDLKWIHGFMDLGQGDKRPVTRDKEAIASNMPSGRASPVPRRASAFTLIELMMVVAIIGLVMAMSVPSILSVVREGPLRKAINDVVEICGHARAQAIFTGKMTTVTFHPRAGEVEYSGGLDHGAQSTRVGQKPVNSTQFASNVQVDLLKINDLDLTDPVNDVAWVRFYPNGTCDEMTLLLHSGDQWRAVTLEETTALASVQTVK